MGKPFPEEEGDKPVVVVQDAAATKPLIDFDGNSYVAENEGEKVSLKELFRFAAGTDFALLVVGTIAAVLNGTSLPIFAYLFGELVNATTEADMDKLGDEVAYYAKWMAVAGAGSFVMSCFMMSSFMTTAERQTAKIQAAFFEAILGQEAAWFDKQKSGLLTARLHGDTKLIRTGLGEKASLFFMHSSTVVSAYIVGFLVSWRLTLVMLGTAPFLGLAGGLAHWAMTQMTEKTRTAYANAGAVSEEVLSSMRTVHSFNAHEESYRRYVGYLDAARDVALKQGFVQGGGMGVAMGTFFMSYTVGFIYASYLVQWGHVDIGKVLACFFSIVIGSFSLGQIGPPLIAFTEARVAAYKVYRVIDRAPRIQSGKKKIESLKGRIEFRGVNFAYPTRHERPVLKDFSLDIEQGKSVALVGLSGCGKSSVVSLVQRLYEPAPRNWMWATDGFRAKYFDPEISYQIEKAVAAGESMLKIKVPIVLDGSETAECVLDLKGMTMSLPGTDGRVVSSTGNAWMWATENGECFTFPTSACKLISEAREKGRTAIVPLAFGVYEVDPQSLTRKNVAVRLQSEENGEVLVDGVPLRDLDLDWWREQVGIVTQEPVLFSGTVLENIRMAKPDATLDEVKAACRKANIHHVIEKWEHGYNTKVGEGGGQLSGGQKQRVAIARAIVRNPKILLLDEATSALDRQAEVRVQEALDSLMGGDQKPTTIVIAHRLQTVRGADKIVVMQPPEEGREHLGTRIAEIGTHEELLAKGGHYALLWRTQMGKSAEGAHDEGENDAKSDTESQMSEEDAQELRMGLTEEEEEELRREKMKQKVKEKSSMKRVASLAMPWSIWMVPGILGALLNGSAYPIYSYLFAHALVEFGELQSLEEGDPRMSSEREDIDIWAFQFLWLGFVAFLGMFLQFGSFGVMGEHLTHRLRSMVFRHLLRQDMAFFDEPEHASGELTVLLSGKAEAIHAMFGPAIGSLCRILFCMGIGLGVSFYYQWKLTLAVAATIPLMAGAGFLNMMLLGQNMSGTERASGGQITSEAISNVRTVKVLNLIPRFASDYGSIMMEETTRKTTRAIGVGLTYGLTQFVLFATFAFALWYGGKLIRDGEASFKEMILVVMEVTMSAMGVGEGTAMQGQGLDARESAADVFEILDREPKIDQMSSTGTSDFISERHITLQGVKFCYPTRPGVQILDDLHLTIPSPASEKGVQVALIGGTGCGKSTVIQLLQRFYDPDEGRITVDGHDLKNVNLQWWRDQVGMVGQEPVLFGQSVVENIRMGRPGATEEEVVEAAKMANIHEDVLRLPEGYATQVGARGSQLSGGQKQRVAIARAIIKKPKILLLDEATSALDNRSEKEVQRALDHVIAEHSMTTITIAHRLTTIQDSDSICVLDKGRVVEQGSHDVLMQIEDGEYRARYNLYHSLADHAHTPKKGKAA